MPNTEDAERKEIITGKVEMRFGEVVLKTSQYDALKSWYCQVLDTQLMFGSERMAEPGPSAMRQMCLIPPYSAFIRLHDDRVAPEVSEHRIW
jgi:hypothetical protein